MRRRLVTIGFGLLVGIMVQLAPSPAAGPKIDLNALAAKKVPVLLEFGRGWCIPCKYMKPILKDMAKAFMGVAIVTTVDMDVNRDLVRAFRIRMMPTQVFLLPDGKEFFRNEGTLERERITQIFGKMGVQPGQVGRASGKQAPKPILPPLPLPGSGQLGR